MTSVHSALHHTGDESGGPLPASGRKRIMNAFLRSVLDTPAPFGSACLWWLGQMGLLVKMGDTLLCVDYYASPLAERQTPAPVPAKEMTGVAAFLGTHNHLDHMDHESWKIWARICPEAAFIFPESRLSVWP